MFGYKLENCTSGVKGIKRHNIVDTMGLILVVLIQSASVQDRDGALAVLEKMRGSWKK